VSLRFVTALTGSYVRDYVVKKGAVEIVKRTALAAVYTAVALPLSVYGHVLLRGAD